MIKGFFITAPSVVHVGEKFSLKIKVLGEVYDVPAGCYYPRSPQLKGRYNISPRGIRFKDNVLSDWHETVAIESDDSYDGPPLYSFTDCQGVFEGDTRPIARIEDLSFSQPGFHFLTVREPSTNATGLSNPIFVSKEESKERLYWGDIHCQTFFSDGLRNPEELYSFARGEGFLDIFALSDHTESLTDRQWDYFADVTNDYYRPHSFVTLVGLEWTNSKLGHRNVYYPGEYGPILRHDDPVYGRLEKVWEAAREHDALVIPHHSANAVMGVDWSLGHDPQVERLVEIYSVWGNSEKSADQGNPRPIHPKVLNGEKKGQHVVDALARGYKTGFIGGGDIHDGRPGDDLHSLQEQPDIYRYLWREGTMGVWAKDLTRKEIFKALYDRRVYATSNVRVFLRVEVCGAFMGSMIQHSGTRTVKCMAASEVPFATIELIRNGVDIRRLTPNLKTFDWSFEDEGSGSSDYYYVRLTRADGEMAWSSPVWVFQ